MHRSGTEPPCNGFGKTGSLAIEEGIAVLRTNWVLGAALAAGLCIWAGTSRADDTVKLNLKPTDTVKTINLLGDGDADTVQVWRRGWGGWGWRGGWGWGGSGWRNSWAWGGGWGWRNSWAWGSPWGWRGGWGWAGSGFRGFAQAPVVFYSPPVYFADPCFAAPTGLNLSVPFVSLSINRTPRAAIAPAPSEMIPAPRPVRPAPGDGTFPYDGGPSNPVPMPQAEQPAPKRGSPATIVPEGRVVSLPAKSPKYGYAAYGEKPERRTTDDRQLAAKSAK